MPLAEPPDCVRVLVPAKVNLWLSVGEPRPDGFHAITTVFHAVGLYDEVVARPADGVRLKISGHNGSMSGSREPDVPSDSRNLAWQAAQLLAERAGVGADVALTLRKSIPVAGGMAGGSADGAAALLACAALWRTGTTRTELQALAADLGSDVAFPLQGGTALGTGRGETVVPVLSRHPQHWVLALHRGGLATPAVYGELDRLRRDPGGRGARPPDRPVEPVLEAVAGGDPRQLALCLSNDLQAAAVSMAPELRRTLRAGVDAGALAGIVSGSGPTCAFLCADADNAVDVAAQLAGVGVCRTVRVAHGPVPGARLVDPNEPPPVPRPPVHA